MFTVLAAAPLTTASLMLSSVLALSTLSLWWVALGRGLKADQLSVGGALVYGLLQGIWIPLAFLMQSEGPFTNSPGPGFGPANQLALGLVASTLVVGGLYLLITGTRDMPAIRAGLAAVGPLLPLLLGFALFMGMLGAVTYDMSAEFYQPDLFTAFMAGLTLCWSGLLPINPLAIPHPGLLGFDPSSTGYGSWQAWPTPWHFLTLLLIQGLLLWVCAAAATRSVELRRRAL
jgi:hypothetical protein